MKLNKLAYLLPLALTPFCSHAQSDALSRETPVEEKGIMETLAKIEKKTDKFNLFFNMHGDFQADFTGPNFDEGKFQMKEFRIEMKGQLTDWLSYRYRQRVSKGDSEKGYRDNLWRSVDIAGIGLKFNKFSMFLGKQCAAYGGFEFDLNPIEIYQYSELLDHATIFMTGIDLAYDFNSNQQLRVQMLNSINESSEERYGKYEKAKLPMVYSLNWNGVFNNFYKTRWSASIMNETKGEHMYYFALGNEFTVTPKFGAYFDWMYAIEGVDRAGIMTDMVEGPDRQKMTSKVDYMSFVLHLNYRFLPKWNIFGKAMYETAGIYKAHDNLEAGNYRTNYGYVGGIEYYPFNDRNLHFYAAYSGRTYKYSWRAKRFGNSNYNDNRIAVGFIWQMPVF